MGTSDATPDRTAWPFIRDTARKRVGNKRVTKLECYVQTYNVVFTLECGHRKREPISARRWEAGYHGPTTTECYTCVTAEVKRIEAGAS